MAIALIFFALLSTVTLARPTGLTRHRDGSMNANSRTHLPPPKNRILVYITTHLPSQHYAFLEGCWPALLGSLPMFQVADFAMFVMAEHARQKVDLDLIQAVFHRTGITIHTRPNPGYQRGAILAMEEGFRNGWFSGYDWVVRLHPDVLVRDDTFLMKTMGDGTASGIFVDCLDRPCPTGRHCLDRLVQTDFFAIRPGAVSPEAFLIYDKAADAEEMITRAFSSIVRNGSDVWLPGTGPHRGACRVGGKRATVVHDHARMWTCMAEETGGSAVVD